MYRDTRPPFAAGTTLKTTHEMTRRIDAAGLTKLILDSLTLAPEERAKASVRIWDRNRNDPDGSPEYVAEVVIVNVTTAKVEDKLTDDAALRRCVAANKEAP